MTRGLSLGRTPSEFSQSAARLVTMSGTRWKRDCKTRRMFGTDLESGKSNVPVSLSGAWKVKVGNAKHGSYGSTSEDLCSKSMIHIADIISNDIDLRRTCSWIYHIRIAVLVLENSMRL